MTTISMTTKATENFNKALSVVYSFEGRNLIDVLETLDDNKIKYEWICWEDDNTYEMSNIILINDTPYDEKQIEIEFEDIDQNAQITVKDYIEEVA